MRRVSRNNPVRRRLFAAELVEEARVDNLANALQEAITAEREEKMRKWNFDFVNEVPLEGPYEWYRCEGPNDWIGVDPVTKTPEDEQKEPDSFISMQAENEVTPKGNKDEEMPLLRKRKQDVNSQVSDKGVRRRISFESD